MREPQTNRCQFAFVVDLPPTEPMGIMATLGAKKNHTICLHIWYLDGEDTKPADLETIEAEVVFLYRQESGQWPQEQTEIHFHPSSNIHRHCARQVVDALKEKLTADKTDSR